MSRRFLGSSLVRWASTRRRTMKRRMAMARVRRYLRVVLMRVLAFVERIEAGLTMRGRCGGEGQKWRRRIRTT